MIRSRQDDKAHVGPRSILKEFLRSIVVLRLRLEMHLLGKAIEEIRGRKHAISLLAYFLVLGVLEDGLTGVRQKHWRELCPDTARVWRTAQEPEFWRSSGDRSYSYCRIPSVRYFGRE